jgi:signal transduction histidine kinase/ligand-binding sensor domain-containing protein/DNA-binding response OmpR family regulator
MQIILIILSTFKLTMYLMFLSEYLRSSLFLFALCVATQLSMAQESVLLQRQISFGELTVEQGLSQNSVVSIAQDSTGYMWFATQDGLNRYDGKDFYHYSKHFDDITRPNYSKLGKIYVDKKGHLWIIPISGKLERYEPLTDTFKKYNPINDVSTIVQSENDYYIGTYGNGMYRLEDMDEEPVQLLKPEDRSLHFYDSMVIQESILFATSGGLITVTGNEYTRTEVEGFKSTAFSTLSKNGDHSVYLGSFGNGLFIKTINSQGFEQFQGFNEHSFPTAINILDLAVDNQNRLWVATYGDGAYLIDFKNESIQHFTANKSDPYALHYNDVLALYEDFTNIMWLGTDGAGLSYFDQHLVKFNILTNKQVPVNIHVDVTRAIAVDKNTIWLGTSGKGLTRIQLLKPEYNTYTHTNSQLAGDRIMSLLHDKQGLWIGHQNEGLQLLDRYGNFKNFPDTSDLTIWKIHKAKNGLLWLCTRSRGLILFDPQTGIMESYTTENSGITSNNIRTVEQGTGNVLWIGTDNNGIFKLSTDTGTISKIAEISDPVKSLYYADEQLWVGTNGNGLIRYNERAKSIYRYSKKDGLPNNVIYGILGDDRSNLWLSSNQGLTRFTIDSDYQPTIENYTNYDGLQALEYNTGAYFKDENGTLYFGGLEGINWFQPSQLTYNQKIPKTVITRMEVFNKAHKMIPDQTLQHNENTVTFSFASLHFSQPERNKYKYRLVNNDPDWILADNNDVAHYTNLPPDEYEFQVISSNYDGVWNNKPATYSFTIAKPWYASNIAKIGYLLLVLLFFYGLYAYFKWRWNVQNQLIKEHEETERLKKLDEFKTNLYTNISHEIRTPLTLISGPVESLLNRPELNETAKKDLNLIKQNSKRLGRLVEQMLDLSLSDSGALKLKIEKHNLTIFLEQLINRFQYKANHKNIVLNIEISELDACWFDRDILEKTVTNLISNALKYAPKNTEITIEAQRNESWLVFSITNDKGDLEIEQLNQLFNRFYQKHESSEGIGVGLALVKELVTLHKGNILVHTADENSIRFTVTLPVNKEAYDESDIVSRKLKEQPKEKTKSELIKKDRSTLLIVEDNSEVLSYIQSVLADDYHIFLAENGQVGIETALKHLPDLIISDVMMPVKSGIDLCNEIKSNELTSHIPIILLTAKVGDQSEIEGLQTGADAYITKPFSVDKLKVRIEKLIEFRKKIKEHFSKSLEINPDINISSDESEFLKKMQEVLNKHITDPQLTSDKFAGLMHVSRTQLHRKLKSYVGMSTTEFIRSQRLKIAGRLLEEENGTISEIAYQIGFNSPSYFIKCFKNSFGCSPLEYRTKHL